MLHDIDYVIAPLAGPLDEVTNMFSALHREAEETHAWLDMRNEEHLTWVPNLEGYLSNLWKDATSTLARAISDLEVVRLAPTAETFAVSLILRVPILEVETRRLETLSPEEFALFVADRLEAMGLEPIRIGHTYSSDGGIDIIAVPKKSTFPFILAVKVKHHVGVRKTGSPNVQRFIGFRFLGHK